MSPHSGAKGYELGLARIVSACVFVCDCVLFCVCVSHFAPVSVSPGLLRMRSSLFCRAAAFFSPAERHTSVHEQDCTQSGHMRRGGDPGAFAKHAGVALTGGRLQLLVLLFPPLPGLENASQAGQLAVAPDGRSANP